LTGFEVSPTLRPTVPKSDPRVGTGERGDHRDARGARQGPGLARWTGGARAGGKDPHAPTRPVVADPGQREPPVPGRAHRGRVRAPGHRTLPRPRAHLPRRGSLSGPLGPRPGEGRRLAGDDRARAGRPGAVSAAAGGLHQRDRGRRRTRRLHDLGARQLPDRRQADQHPLPRACACAPTGGARALATWCGGFRPGR
jgi:hypothetical protein